MASMWQELAGTLAGSAAHDTAIQLLSTVPGLPPIVQTLHLLAIAAVMGSVVVLDLRVLGLASRGQRVSELVDRLMPRTWWALPVLLLSGSMFVLARPGRYFANPVFAMKFALLVPAVLAAGLLQLMDRSHPALWDQPSGERMIAKFLAVMSLMAWLGVVLAGRWIAYADYLLPLE